MQISWEGGKQMLWLPLFQAVYLQQLPYSNWKTAFRINFEELPYNKIAPDIWGMFQWDEKNNKKKQNKHSLSRELEFQQSCLGKFLITIVLLCCGVFLIETIYIY